MVTGPGVGDAHPAGAVLVGVAVAVPVEPDLDPPILVGPDLFPWLTDDDGDLGVPDSGFRRDPRGAVGRFGVQGGEFTLEDWFDVCLRGRAEGLGVQLVVGRYHQVLPVLVPVGGEGIEEVKGLVGRRW